MSEPTQEDIRNDRLGNDITPVTRAEVEPMLLLDTSGSMSQPAAPGTKVSKIGVVGEAIGAVIRRLETEDSQAEAERAEGKDEAEIGGVYCVTFADGAVDREDINSANLAKKWAEIEGDLGGQTHIVAGWNKLVEIYTDEFGDRPLQERPHLLALVVTDGEAQDGAKFGEILAQQGKQTHVVVAVVGHGDDHDATLRQYQGIASQNDHVRVLSFDSVTDPNEIANSVLACIGK